MDKRVVLAVAGSGKTTSIINSLQNDSRALIITYTINNVENIKNRIIKKFGLIPNGIKIYGYFSFLYTFCYKPILHVELNSKGLIWQKPPIRTKITDSSHYFTKNNYIYANRLAKLIINFSLTKTISRIEKYFDYLYVDEIQDFGGNDFNLLVGLAKAKINQLLVGDFYQHTFDTSRDGNTNAKLHEDYDKYIEKLGNAGHIVDKSTLSASHRCSHTVCLFITNKLKISINSHRSDSTLIEFISCEKEALNLFRDDKVVKLFYQSSNKYSCYGDNWGAVKGLDDFLDVCVVLNDTTLKHYTANTLHELPSKTINKLYVACSRARNKLYFIPEKTIRKINCY
ncbi:DNA helicase UvrD [uncultured Psychrobacter sp.]|uniref:DNA helicase UvrD n=1 Tax=uncultured Psychrobacter sp. TaxID=259303 RepID=UPI003457EB3E